MNTSPIIRAKRIEAPHFRMARAGVNLSIRELAQITGMNKATIVRLEAGQSVRESSSLAARQALETKGVSFWKCRTTNKIMISVEEG